MKFRSMLSMATFTVAALAFVTGCPEDTKKTPPTAKPGKGAKNDGKTAKPAGSTKPASAGAKKAGAGSKFGKGTIKGMVKFTGTAPEMKVPKKRKASEFCKDKDVTFNAVLAKDGKLQDVFVGIADEQLKGEYTSEKAATVEQSSCMYMPRIQGLLPEQPIMIKNSDPTLHNVNAGLGTSTLFNTAQAKGAPALKKSFEDVGVHRLKCDVHTWMRAFIVVTDNPFHAVTGEDGTFTIAKVPDGKYKMVAWHSQYGKKESKVEVKGGEATLEFVYDGKEEAPAVNKDELKDLF